MWLLVCLKFSRLVEKQVSTTLAFKYFPINMLSFFYYNTNYNTETTDVATIGSNAIIIIIICSALLLKSALVF